MSICRGTSFVTLVCLGLSLLTACSAKEESQVSLILPSPRSSAVQSVPTAGDGSSLNITPTGLISNKACYFIHVTAPDLIVPGSGGGGQPDASCKVPVSGLGKMFGPYKYGADVVIKVPSGSGRVFDLIGFINPYSNDPDCSRPWREQLMTKPNGEQSPEFFYGEYLIDSDDAAPAPFLEPQGPDGKLLAFARSAPTNLAPGIVKVPLNRIEWTDEQPTRYACGGSKGDNNNAIFPQMQDGVITTGMDEELFLDIRCPSGASQVSLRVSGNLDHTYPAQTCFSGRAMFSQIRISDTSGKKPAGAAGCWFDWNKDGIDVPQEHSPCLVFDATPGSTFAGTPFISGRVQFQSMYRNVMYTPTPPAAQQALAIGIDPAKVKFAGYEKSGSIREVYVASGSSVYSDLRKIVFKPQEVLGTGYRTSSFEWNGNTSTLASSQLPSGPPGMFEIISGKIGSSVSTVNALFFTNFSSGNFFGAVKFSAPQGYPVHSLPADQGNFGAGDRIVSENGLQVASSRLQFNTFLPNLPMSGSTFTVSNHDLVDGQIVRLNDAITDAQCGASTASSSGAHLKVFDVNATTFKLKTLGDAILTTNANSCLPHFTARSFYAMRTTSNDDQTTLQINTGNHKTIPMFPAHNGNSYDTVSKILLDAPTTGKTTVVSLDSDANAGSAQVTKCDPIGAATGCTNPRSYRIPTADGIRDADLLVGEGDPLLLVMTNGTNGTMNRYSLGDSATQLSSGVFHPPLNFPVSIKFRSLRLRDQNINSSRDAILYVEQDPNKDIYRTRDAGANWYKVHMIPQTNTILDIIPAHAHTKNDEGDEHWEPSFLMLERFDKDGLSGNNFFDLRVLGQDWHGF